VLKQRPIRLPQHRPVCGTAACCISAGHGSEAVAALALTPAATETAAVSGLSCVTCLAKETKGSVGAASAFRAAGIALAPAPSYAAAATAAHAATAHAVCDV
jgi:hypothetical protein